MRQQKGFTLMGLVMAMVTFGGLVATTPPNPIDLAKDLFSEARGATLNRLSGVIDAAENLRKQAATELAKWIDLSKLDVFGRARIATLNGLSGAIDSATHLAHAKCLVTAGCDANGLSAATSPVRMWYGYPAHITAASVVGIQDLIEYDGFTYVASNAGYADFRKNGAPNPAACYVRYTPVTAGGGVPTTRIVTSGC